MKRIFCSVIMTLVLVAVASAEPLFPFFVDLVGNYDEVEMPGASVCLKGRTNAGGEQAAAIFLQDTLPDGVLAQVKEIKKADGRVIRGYWADMLDGVVSVIYFITKPDGTFTIEYAEGKPEAVLSTFGRK
ncbi:MAG: hypothetical protein J6L73_07330 [Muribaculaceae bacterium]|nr:hypothetical protein [Muribaculaceae bacterium]